MSLQTSESVGYVHCNFCTTILATNPYYHQLQKQLSRNEDKADHSAFGSSSFASLEPPAVVAPVKRPRVPSAYNRFIKEEIKRIKVSNPEITHREAFSTAAKNWAHFPHINFGLNLD